MLSEAAAINPSEKAEDRPPSSDSKKSASLKTEEKIYKSKIPTSKSGRNDTRGSSANHQTCEESSEISSGNNSARRPVMKILSTPLSKRKLMNTGPAEKRHLETQYGTKKIRYANLRKTLADKQKIAQELHNEMSNLREKIIAAGGKDPGKIEELKSLQVECPKEISATPTETSLQHDYAEIWEQICMDEATVMSVSLLQDQLQNLCDHSEEFYESVLDRGSRCASIIKNWLAELLPQYNYNEQYEKYDIEKMQKYLTDLEHENKKTKVQLEEIKTIQDNFVTEFSRRSSELCSEYNKHCEHVKKIQPIIDRKDLQEKDLQEKLNMALEKLKAERDTANKTREGMKIILQEMYRLQTQMCNTETTLNNLEASQLHLPKIIKSLQIQVKQTVEMSEMRMKDMQKSMKNSEDLVAKIEKQRDNFESRVVELKEKMTCKETEANVTIMELSEKLKALNVEFNKEREEKKQAENALNEMKERCQHLEKKDQLLCEFANKKNNNLAVTDNNYTEKEASLYNDLQIAYEEVEKQREQIQQLKKDQEIAMHQSRDNEDETKNKLAAELVAKTHDLQNLMLEYAKLQKVAKFKQERNEVLENQLSEIQRRLYAKSKEDGKPELDTIELQQQISDLRNNLTEVIQQNQQLESTLTQKQLELEQRDRVMREQSKFLKVRNELLNLLKEKQQANADNSANGNYEEIDEINKQIIEKTEAIQELYATLEGKQMQVMRLEKLVKLLEDQQDRAQAQRTRLEHRIAQLEVSLQEKDKNDSNRSRTFGIL